MNCSWHFLVMALSPEQESRYISTANLRGRASAVDNDNGKWETIVLEIALDVSDCSARIGNIGEHLGVLAVSGDDTCGAGCGVNTWIGRRGQFRRGCGCGTGV